MGNSMKTRSLIGTGLVIIAAVIFSLYIMFHTFTYEPRIPAIRMGSKLWSDFGSQIPLIRSFSYGDNLNRMVRGEAPEYPGYPGEPIRYHFGFYFFAGLLERLGVRIDWALNIPSAIGMALLLIMIFMIAKRFFNSFAAGILAIFFLVFNGTFAVFNFLKIHPLNANFLTAVVQNKTFPAFGPWDGNAVTAFWNLNIYTNQRHLAMSYGLILVMLYLILNAKPKMKFVETALYAVSISALMDMLLFINLPAAAMAGVCLLWFFVIRPESRIPLAIGAFLSAPWLWYLIHITAPSFAITFKPGYLTHSPLTAPAFLRFWLANLGLHTILIPIGMVLAPKRTKMLFIIPILIIFIVPNIFQFSPDMINNHKFFNFFLILGNMFSAYAVVSLIGHISHMRLIWLKPVFYLFPAALLLCLTASGIIDFFAVTNDNMMDINDVAANPDAEWIMTHTPPGAVFLNSTWLYHPASLAGRFIFSGYPYFTWSYGYDKDKREDIARASYAAVDKSAACTLARKNNISYVEITQPHEDYVSPDPDLWLYDFTPVYRHDNFRIYDMNTACIL
jgi:hypothetical protein